MLGFRIKAFSIHFFASAIVISLFLALIFLLWYPTPFQDLMSVWKIIGMVVLVDLVLGPLMTLVIANPAKAVSELKKDISVIVLVQLVALGAGVGTVYEGRPAYLVFDTDRFFVLTRPELIESEGSPGVSLPGIFSGPALAYVNEPSDPDKAFEDSFIAMASGGGSVATFQAEHYKPFDEHHDEIYLAGIPYAEIRQNSGDASAEIERLAQKHAEAELLFYTVVNNGQFGTLVLDKHLGAVVDYLDMEL